MNAKSILLSIIVLSVCLAACAAPTAAPQVPAHTYQPTAAPAQPTRWAAPEPTQVWIAPAPTMAPMPTSAPASIGSAPTTYAPQPIGGASAPTATPAWAVPYATPPVDNTFRDYGVNPYVATSQDHLSTFALDVDTASYTLARRYVQEGNLPPADAIRVEEFVNFFKQDYALPSNVAFGLYADGAPSPFHHDGSYLVRFGVQGYSVPEAQRKPLDLTFVIDVSGSMQEQGRLEMVKKSLTMLVDRLRPVDTVAIVAYTTDAWVALNPTNGADRNSILNAIYSLHPMNTTNVEAGLRLGYQLAAQIYRAGATNRVILCSDGVANVGNTDPAAILDFVHGYTDEGITLTSVGVGMGNFNDVLLEQLADKGDGNYTYVDNLQEAQRALVENMVSTLQVIALDAKVQVDFNSEVVGAYRLIGYENRAVADSDFRNNAVDAGGLGAGHAATALYAVQLKPGATGRLATMQLRWQDPDTRKITEINGNVNTWDLAQSFEGASPRYQQDVVVMQYAEILRHSPWAEGSSLGEVARYASQLPELIPNDPDVAEFARLTAQAAGIEQ